ncbi:aldehyde ferredoxin oxidoreductase [Candidatus Bathyarchaeota archaeon]|nr:MAG: aldehyde ferredoxin oxidoreductase [Candidatus Bathyarchaeota archaeon]
MKGYAGKFLEVDLSNEKIKETSFPEEILREYIGGRGLAAKILWDRLGKKWETIDPLSPENILLVLTGPLTGYFPGTKVCVSGKSPQSNGVIGSTIAGEFGVDLKCAGYDGLIITGKAEKPSYIFICDGHVEIKDATPIWGRKARETLRFLVKKSVEEVKAIKPNYGEVKEPSILHIGPAGENRTRVAAVVAKYAHGAGYGGYGGVMGSKNLKAIVAKGFGPLPEVYDRDEVIRIFDEISKRNFEVEGFRRWGTGKGGYHFGAETSSEPVRNWQEEWHNMESFRGEEFDKYWIKKYWGDFGCPVTCLKLAVLKEGRFRGAICDNPDYELQAYLGANLGIFKAEDNIYISYVSNELGLCGIQGGAVLGFAAELYQRGILTKEDLDGLELEWGNAEAFAVLAEKIAYRQGIGDILAEGVYRAALKLGEMKGTNLLKYVVHEKGVAIGAHGVRSGKDFAKDISYACSVQAGDHTSLASIDDGRSGEISTILSDSAVYCNFVSFALDDMKPLFKLYEAVTGWSLSEEEWYGEKGLRILQLQRALLLLGGPDRQWKPKIDDDNPQRFWEPLPSGPYKGKTVDRETFERNRLEYYRLVGWDENGVPKPETLRKLGLHDVETKLREVGLLN